MFYLFAFLKATYLIHSGRTEMGVEDTVEN
jgi:hypothetical protein